MKNPVIAIVPAAGSGVRFRSGINKAFVEILGKPLIIRVLEKFQNSNSVSEIVPVFSENDLDRGLCLIEQFGISKVKKVAPGGMERQDSVYNALKHIDNQKSLIVVHDGARPFVDEEILQRCIKALKEADGVVTAVPLKDTVKEVREGLVHRTLDRSRLIAVQTPQVFRYDTLVRAYETVRGKGSFFTDDASVVEAAGGKIAVVEGSYLNIKVTTPEDALVLETYLNKGML